MQYQFPPPAGTGTVPARVQTERYIMFALKTIFTAKKPDTSAEHSELCAAIEHILCEMSAARLNFQEARDPDLVDACVFEMNALQSRYAYLLRRARECGALGERVLR